MFFFLKTGVKLSVISLIYEKDFHGTGKTAGPIECFTFQDLRTVLSLPYEASICLFSYTGALPMIFKCIVSELKPELNVGIQNRTDDKPQNCFENKGHRQKCFAKSGQKLDIETFIPFFLHHIAYL